MAEKDRIGSYLALWAEQKCPYCQATNWILLGGPVTDGVRNYNCANCHKCKCRFWLHKSFLLMSETGDTPDINNAPCADAWEDPKERDNDLF